MDPSRSQSFLILATIQEKSKDLASAEQSYLKAVSLDSEIHVGSSCTGEFLSAPETLVRRRKAVSSRDHPGSE